MSKESVAKTLQQWDQLLGASDANAEDLVHLAALRAELLELSERVKALKDQQSALAAMRQQVSRDLDATKDRGRYVAVRIRDGIRSRYGVTSPKLIAFGLRPRGKKRRSPKRETSPDKD